MKKVSPFVFVLLFSHSSACVQHTWAQKKDFDSIPRAWSTCFSIGYKGYVCTGYVPSKGYLKDLWEYDPFTDTWTRKADFPGEARSFTSSFVVNGKAYVFGGSSMGVSIGYNDVWEYSPADDRWTRKADFPGAQRDYAVGFSIQDKGYYGTGRDIHHNYFYNDFWEYDPQRNVWTKKSDFGGRGRCDAVGFATDHAGYIGYGSSRGGVIESDFWEYDPASDTWARKTSRNLVRAGSNGAFVLDNKPFLVTGALNSGPANQVWRYDPASDSWAQQDSFPGSRRFGTFAFSIGNRGYLVSGDKCGWCLLADVWEFRDTSSLGRSSFELGDDGIQCINSMSLDLRTKGPANGYYYGAGVEHSLFFPWKAGLGSHVIYCASIDAANCVSLDSAKVLVNACDVTGIHAAALNAIQLYPNPSSSGIHLKAPTGTKALCIIFNSLGQEVHRVQIQEEITTIPAGSFPQGLYWAKVVTNGVVKMEKFVVQ